MDWKPITDAEWNKIRAMMEQPFGIANLCCDGFEVSLIQRVDSKAKKFFTVAYVNDHIKGLWCNADKQGDAVHEEARRFWRKKTFRVYPAKIIEGYRKAFGKKKAKEMEDARYFCFSPEWLSFTSLKKHLLANNTEIMVKVDEWGLLS